MRSAPSFAPYPQHKCSGFFGVAMSGGGSSSGKCVGKGRGKGGGKGPPILWDGSLGPDFFDEPLDEFPLESKSDFTNEAPLRGYDNRKEDWPKCRHGQDCLVQMCNDAEGGGRRFFRCPRGWVFVMNYILLQICL